MFGDGPLRTSLTPLAREPGIDPWVDFPGRVDDGELARYLGEVALNLHCSTAEGWCLSAVEAAASGVPTVAYDTPGLRTVVRDGVSGRPVSDGDIASMATAGIEILRGDAGLWRSRARAVSEEFDGI